MLGLTSSSQPRIKRCNLERAIAAAFWSSQEVGS
jgi:hypothetical protein